MKFLLALTVVALAAVGCGQNHGNQDRSQPAPAAPPAVAKANVDGELSTVPGAPGTSYADQVNAIQASLPDAQPVQVSIEAKSAGERLGYWSAMLNTLQKSLNDAERARNNSIHLPYAFLDATAWGVTTGLFGYDGVRGLHKIYLEKFKNSEPGDASVSKTVRSSRVAKTADAAEAVAAEKEVSLFSKIASRTSEATTEYVLPVGGRLTETAAAAIMAVYAIGKVSVLYNDLEIRFSDTNAMRTYKAQITEAKSNIDRANRDLNAINYQERASAQ